MEARSVGRIIVIQVVATLALGLALFIVAGEFKEDVRDSEQRARLEQTSQLRGACARGVARDFESEQTNNDLRVLARVVADFAGDAAGARRQDGNSVKAKEYESSALEAVRIADRVGSRIDRISLRLPPSQAEADIVVFCRKLFPVPTTSPG